MTNNNRPNRIFPDSHQSRIDCEYHFDIKINKEEYKILLHLSQKHKKSVKMLIHDEIKKFIEYSKFVEMSFL